MRHKIVRWLIIVILGLIPLGLLLYSGWTYFSAQELTNELTSIRAAGEPLAPEDLLPAGDEIDGRDAAPLYESALSTLETSNPEDLMDLLRLYDDRTSKRPLAGVDESARARLQQILTTHGEAIELLAQASVLPECRHVVSIDRPDYMDRIDQVRFLADLALLRIADAALRGEGDTAVDATISGLRLLRLFDRAPFAHFMVATGIRHAISRRIPLVLESRPTDAALTRLEEALRELDRPGSLTDALLAERVYVLLRIRNLVEGTAAMNRSTQRAADEWPQPGLLDRPLWQHRMTALLRDVRDLVRASQTPWPGVRDAVRRVRVQSVFSKPLQVIADSTVDSLGQLLATVRSARIAILVERFRRGQGSLPRSLAEIESSTAGSLSRDPFSGEALIFTTNDAGYIIYSVGPNGTDDVGDVGTDTPGLDAGLRFRLADTR